MPFYDDTIQAQIRDSVAGQTTAPLSVQDSAGGIKAQVTAGTAGVTGAGLQIGPAGTPLTKIQRFGAALTPAAVAANTTAEQTFNPAAFAGLGVADTVYVNKPTAQAGLGIVGVRVSAAGTLAITFCNVTAGALTPTAAETYNVVAILS